MPPLLLLQPKLAQHNNQCSASGYTCIDCSLSFDRRSVQASPPARMACMPARLPCSSGWHSLHSCPPLCASAWHRRSDPGATHPPSLTHCRRCWTPPLLQGHTQCVTEHEKYALGATKPGGYAATGFSGEGSKPTKQGQEGELPPALDCSALPALACSALLVPALACSACAMRYCLCLHAPPSLKHHLSNVIARNAMLSRWLAGCLPTPPQSCAGQPEGLEFLTTRAPWKCTICAVNCTSQDTLMGHAAGAKHKRRVGGWGYGHPGSARCCCC
jgi:hypothetical protein